MVTTPNKQRTERDRAVPAGHAGTLLFLGHGRQTTPGISGLAAGTYQVTVTDALGCDTTLTAVVSARLRWWPRA